MPFTSLNTYGGLLAENCPADYSVFYAFPPSDPLTPFSAKCMLTLNQPHMQVQ